MKVVVLTDSMYGRDSEYVPGGQPIAEGLSKAFKERGHESRILTSSDLGELIVIKPDFIVSLSPVIGFPTNALKVVIIHDTYRGMDFRDSDADIFLTNSMLLKSQLALYKPTFYFQFAADPEVFRPVEPVEKYKHDFVYLGNGRWKDKALMKAYLGVVERTPPKGRLKLYGYGWGDTFPNCDGGILPVGKEAELYSSAKVVLNFTKSEQKLRGMVCNRVFEALACGAVLLTDRLRPIQQMFGDCCLIEDVWTSEVLEKALSLHSDKAFRAGARKCIVDRHTWSHRIGQILEIVACYKGR